MPRKIDEKKIRERTRKKLDRFLLSLLEHGRPAVDGNGVPVVDGSGNPVMRPPTSSDLAVIERRLRSAGEAKMEDSHRHPMQAAVEQIMRARSPDPCDPDDQRAADAARIHGLEAFDGDAAEPAADRDAIRRQIHDTRQRLAEIQSKLPQQGGQP